MPYQKSVSIQNAPPLDCRCCLVEMFVCVRDIKMPQPVTCLRHEILRLPFCNWSPSNAWTHDKLPIHRTTVIGLLGYDDD